MDKQSIKQRRAFISFLDEKDVRIDIYVDIVKFDAAFLVFKTNQGNLITIPTARILKIKEKDNEVRE